MGSVVNAVKERYVTVKEAHQHRRGSTLTMLFNSHLLSNLLIYTFSFVRFLLRKGKCLRIRHLTSYLCVSCRSQHRDHPSPGGEVVCSRQRQPCVELLLTGAIQI